MKLEEFQAGSQVFVYTNIAGTKHKFFGTVGNAWEEGGPQLIVVFPGNKMVYVTAENAKHFHQDAAN